jgi:hypothetical protein
VCKRESARQNHAHDLSILFDITLLHISSPGHDKKRPMFVFEMIVVGVRN